MSSSVTVAWDKENFNQTLNKFSFQRYFSSETFPSIFFAEFNQGIKFAGVTEEFTKMYFTGF